MNTPSSGYTRTQRTGRLRFSTKLFQGIGAVPDTIKNWVFNTFVLLFYNQILGVDALMVSTVLAVALIFDALTDPIVATISDNLTSRWGRRHPLMLLGAVPLGLCFYPVFSPPEGLSHYALCLWLLTFVLLTRLFMTFYFIPWAAIAAELSDDYEERTSVMAFRYAVGWTVGVLFPLSVFTFFMVATADQPVGQLNQDNYPAMAAAAAVLMTLGGVATTLLTRREIPYLRQHRIAPARPGLMVVFREIAAALRNEQFALIFTVVLILAVIGGTTTNLGIYMTTFFWGLTSEDLRWFVLSASGAVIAFPLVALVQKRWDKRNILIACALVSLLDGMVVVALRFLDVLPENGDPMLLKILVSMGVFAVGLAVIQGVIGASIIADVLDYHEMKTGLRQEAMFNAALSFSGKAASGIGIVMGGMLLSYIAMPPKVLPADVPPDVITRLGVVVGLVVPLFYLVPIFLIRRYKISREMHQEIQEALNSAGR
jgi:Na+/melibiose symporter-like transporter